MHKSTRLNETVKFALLFCFVASGVHAQEAEIVSGSSAKGIIVFRLSFPSRGPVAYFGMEIDSGEGQYASANAGPMRGKSFTGNMVKNASVGNVTILTVPIVADFSLGSEKFLFVKPGEYHIRWKVYFVDRTIASLTIDQTVQIDAPEYLLDSGG